MNCAAVAYSRAWVGAVDLTPERTANKHAKQSPGKKLIAHVSLNSDRSRVGTVTIDSPAGEFQIKENDRGLPTSRRAI